MWRTLVLKNKLFTPRFAAPVVGFSNTKLKVRRQLAEVEMCGMLKMLGFTGKNLKFTGEVSAALSCRISLGILVDLPLEGLLG